MATLSSAVCSKGSAVDQLQMEFGDVSNCCHLVDTEEVGFNEDLLIGKPCHKLGLVGVKLISLIVLSLKSLQLMTACLLHTHDS